MGNNWEISGPEGSDQGGAPTGIYEGGTPFRRRRWNNPVFGGPAGNNGYSWMPQSQGWGGGGGYGYNPIQSAIQGDMLSTYMDKGKGLGNSLSFMNDILQGNANRRTAFTLGAQKNQLIAAVIAQMGKLGQGQPGTGQSFGSQTIPTMSSNIVPQPIYTKQGADQIAGQNAQTAQSAGNLYNAALPGLGQAATTNTQIPTGIDFSQNGQRMGGATIGAVGGLPAMGGMGQGGVNIPFYKSHIWGPAEAAKMAQQADAGDKSTLAAFTGGDPGRTGTFTDLARGLSSARQSRINRAGYQAQSGSDLKTDIAAATARNEGNREVANQYGMNLRNYLAALMQKVKSLQMIENVQGGGGSGYA